MHRNKFGLPLVSATAALILSTSQAFAEQKLEVERRHPEAVLV